MPCRTMLGSAPLWSYLNVNLRLGVFESSKPPYVVEKNAGIGSAHMEDKPDSDDSREVIHMFQCPKKNQR